MLEWVARVQPFRPSPSPSILETTGKSSIPLLPSGVFARCRGDGRDEARTLWRYARVRGGYTRVGDHTVTTRKESSLGIWTCPMAPHRMGDVEGSRSRSAAGRPL